MSKNLSDLRIWTWDLDWFALKNDGQNLPELHELDSTTSSL